MLSLSSLSKYIILTTSHVNVIHRKEVLIQTKPKLYETERSTFEDTSRSQTEIAFLILATGKLLISEKKLELEWLVLSTPWENSNTALAHLERTESCTNAAREYFSESACFYMQVAFDHFLINHSFCGSYVTSGFPLPAVTYNSPFLTTSCTQGIKTDGNGNIN